jgi:uncharacterized phiE125 gp8 family phage protein
MINKPAQDLNMVWKVTTEPIIEPVTVDEVKEFARIDGSDENAILAGYITAARMAAEDYLGLALIEQTITLKMDYWPSEIISLPRPPLISITAVETLDEGDTATTYASTNYYTITTSWPGKIVIKQSTTFPENDDRSYGGFQIRYKAGFGNIITDVPRIIREAIKIWTTEIYENRAISTEPSLVAKNLLNSYRIHQI